MASKLPSLLSIVLGTILGILSMIVLLANGFIISVNGHQWLQNRKMAPCDFFLTTMSTSRFLLQLVSLLGYPVQFNVPLPKSYSYALDVMNISCFFLNTVNLWCATWLSVFYCVKVINFPHPFFFLLKTRINVLAPKLLGMSITVSMIFSLPELIGYIGNKKTCNGTEIQPEIIQTDPLFFPHLSVAVISLIINITASSLLVISLWRHTRNLRKSGILVKDLSIQIHITVMKSLLFYLFFSVLYFMAMVLAMGNNLVYGEPEQLGAEILLSVFFLLHTTILILTNPKLKEASVRILKIR